MIQRYQTLCLLISAAMTIAFLFVPMGYMAFGNADGTKLLIAVKPICHWYIVVPSLISALTALVSIFMFKNLKRQKLVVKASSFFSFVTVAATTYALWRLYASQSYVFSFGVVLIILALSGLLVAIRGISADQRLISSYDRLR